MSLIYFVLSNVRLAWNFHEPWCDATPSPTRTEFYCLRKSTNFSNCGSSVGGLKRWTGGALWCFRQPTFVCVTKIHIFMMFLNWSNQVEWQLLLHLFFLVVFFFLAPPTLQMLIHGLQISGKLVWSLKFFVSFNNKKNRREKEANWKSRDANRSPSSDLSADETIRCRRLCAPWIVAGDFLTASG